MNYSNLISEVNNYLHSSQETESNCLISNSRFSFESSSKLLFNSLLEELLMSSSF